MTGRQGQTLDVLVGDQHTLAHLRQQTGVVGDIDRSHRAQTASIDVGIAYTRLKGGGSLVQAAGALCNKLSAAVASVSQFITNRTECVNTEAHYACGIARLVVKHEALSPLATFSSAINLIIDVIVTQIQAQLAVLDEISDSE